MKKKKTKVFQLLPKSIAGLAWETRNPNGWAGTTPVSQPFQLQIHMAIPGGRRQKGSGTDCLSAGIAAQQLLLQPAGGAAWRAAELCAAGAGDRGGRLLTWTSNFNGVHSAAQTCRSKWAKITFSYFCLTCH